MRDPASPDPAVLPSAAQTCPWVPPGPRHSSESLSPLQHSKEPGFGAAGKGKGWLPPILTVCFSAFLEEAEPEDVPAGEGEHPKQGLEHPGVLCTVLRCPWVPGVPEEPSGAMERSPALGAAENLALQPWGVPSGAEMGRCQREGGTHHPLPSLAAAQAHELLVLAGDKVDGCVLQQGGKDEE